MKWLPLDLLLVSIFAVIGRLSHREAVDPAGWWHTAWPFLLGALAGWGLTLLMGWAPGGPAAGVAIWVAAVAGGMALRHFSGQGTAVPFIVVASVVLALMLVLPRLAVAWGWVSPRST